MFVNVAQLSVWRSRLHAALGTPERRLKQTFRQLRSVTSQGRSFATRVRKSDRTKTVVWYAIASFGFGGLEIRILEEAERLTQRGYHVTFICNPGSPIFAEASRRQFPVIGLAMRQCFDVMAIVRMMRLLRQVQPHILHVHTSRDHWIGGVAGRLAAVPLVRTRHIGCAVSTNPFSSAIYRHLSDRIIASSQAIKQDLLRIPALPEERVTVIAGGANLERFRASADGNHIKQEFQLQKGAPLIGCIARLDAPKGQQYLITALQDVVSRYPTARLLLIGEGPGRSILERQVVALGLEHHVTFTGFRRDVPDILAAMTVVAVPSTCPEAIPQIIIQTLAMGKPVVASRVGGVAELVIDGQTGLLVEPQDSGALAAALIWVLSHPKEAMDMARCGKVEVLARYSLDRDVDATEAVYRALL